jgi:Rrf2 family iron-sulfur cluster assembly transcriptional regulator
MKTKITKKTQYAVAAMLELAKSDAPMPVSTISSVQLVDRDYMSIILSELKRKNLVLSIRGTKGGYKLAKPLEEIAISDIMTAVGETIKITRCRGKGSCTGTETKCMSHKMWEKLEEQTVQYLSSLSLRDILESGKTSTS